MPGIYLRLQVDFDDDEKVARLARYTRTGEARACRDLLVAMWRYCKREKTDGHVPVEVVGKLVYPDPPKFGVRDADRLVDVGLAEHTPTGYYLPGFLGHNRSAAQIEAESARKADAGRKGGKVSGQLRLSEAQGKHSASTLPTSLLQPREAIVQSTENIVQSSGVKSLGGERQVTFRDTTATEHPPRCTAHQNVDNPGPCNGCRLARERADRKAARSADQVAREAEAAARACARCDGTRVVDESGMPTRQRCDHSPVPVSA